MSYNSKTVQDRALVIGSNGGPVESRILSIQRAVLMMVLEQPLTQFSRSRYTLMLNIVNG